MASKVKPIPEGYHVVTPYLVVREAARAIEFYKKAFGATEIMRIAAPNGRIGHAEVRIGDSIVMLSDEYPEMGSKSPQALGGSPVTLLLYVADVDAVVDRALTAGGKLTQPIEDKFYGDRSGTVTDPFGHMWHVSTHKEDVPPDELRRRAEAFMQQQAKA